MAPLARAELVAVQWHRDGYLSVRYLSDGGRYDVHSVELYVAGVDQALDVLCALGLLPADLSTLYAAGVRAGLRAGDALDGQLVEDGPR
ncbi:hypothetical protein [Micromonospora inyonensis]|uniref:Uncharacterized protein n=1 Tax=Micromonospora inyonensis TaxID=47866 RepID=A0A1C6SV88_9ACTN|nr:hypothetical protein [Micromonospora inyonensis]SCL33387.1 hypothetical protein GA0074694_6214 [Micromonospora inyonensis]